MFSVLRRYEDTFLFRAAARLMVLALSVSLALGPSAAQAQTVLNLPVPGAMLPVTAAFTPAHITGVTIHPENPLEFEFIVAKGDSGLDGTAFAEESRKLIKYFLASLTVPEEQMWVNLSPHEKDRIIPEGFGRTEMGRDMLAQDYLLKQLTASLMYPEEELGKKFWDKVYKRAQKEFGTTGVPVNTFNKVWIVPETAVVYEHGQTAYVVQARLKVMLDSDYAAMQYVLKVEDGGEKVEKGHPDQHPSSNLNLQSSIIKEIILPEIEKEVNEGETFANLRQIYHSLILAAWYKKKLLSDENGRRSLLGQLYVDQNKTAGVDVDDPEVNRKIYAQYLKAFQKGVYNYIREDLDPATEEVIPRKYFSGGITVSSPVNGTTLRLRDKLAVRQSLPPQMAASIGTTAKKSSRVTVKLVEETGHNERILQSVSSPVNTVLPRVDPTKTAAWSKLRELAATKKYDLRAMFDADPGRAQRFRAALDDTFQVDFSKNLIDSETLAVLQELAQETQLTQAIEQMFTGEKINETENRAVLHTALRNVTRDPGGRLAAANGPVYVDGEDVMPEVIAVLNKMEAFTRKVRSGEWKGATGKRIRHVVNVGIGGSDLGPKMAAEALKAYGRDSGITAHFVSNVDGTAAAELIRELGDPEETLIVIESKTFTTQETIQNALTLKNWVVDYYQKKAGVRPDDAIKKHFVAVSTARDLVEGFGIDPENMFAFWDWVGGRYSMWSAIGLTLATYIGFDNFLQMLEGAREADEHFRHKPFDQNIPILKALLGVWNLNFLNAETYAILPYDQYLFLLPAFLQQGFMESQGKGTDRNGRFITDYKTVQVLWGAAGTDGQHSFHQPLHQARLIVPADFIGIARTQNPLPGHHEKLYSNFVAQPYALAFGSRLEEVMKALDDGKMSPDELRWLAAHRTFPGNKPTTSIFIDEMTPRALGQLISVYENQIMAEGVIYNIFSFDQWGVQLGKVVATKNVLDFLNGARPLSELDAVPYGATIREIVERFREKQPKPGSSSPFASDGMVERRRTSSLRQGRSSSPVEELAAIVSTPYARLSETVQENGLSVYRAGIVDLSFLNPIWEFAAAHPDVVTIGGIVAGMAALGRGLYYVWSRHTVSGNLYRLQSSDWKARQAAAEALGKLGDTRAVEPLIKLLADKDSDVRQAAADALGKLGDTRAVEPLIELLANGYYYVRQAAAEALGKLGASKEQMVEGYIAALGSSFGEVRRAAAEALGKLGDTRAVEPLIELLANGSSYVHQAAAEALGKLGDTRAVEPLIELLANGSSYVRRAAAGTLGELGDTHAVEPLIKLLTDKDSDVRRAAAGTLGRLGDPKAIGPLDQLLENTPATITEDRGYSTGPYGETWISDWQTEDNPEYLAIQDAIAKLRVRVKDISSLPVNLPQLNQTIVQEILTQGKIALTDIRDERLKSFLSFLKRNNLTDVVVIGGAVKNILFDEHVSDIDISMKMDLSETERAALTPLTAMASERIYAQAAERVAALAKALGLDAAAFLPPARGPRQIFEGLDIDYFGPIKTDKGAIIKRSLFDTATKKGYFTNTAASLLRLAIDAEGNIYGDTTVLQDLMKGKLPIAGNGANFGINDVLRILRLKHQYGLEISADDHAMMATAISRHENQTVPPIALEVANTQIKKLLRDARNPQAARRELDELKISALLERSAMPPGSSSSPFASDGMVERQRTSSLRQGRSSSPVKEARGDLVHQLENALGKRKGIWSLVRGALWKNGPSNMEIVNLINAVSREEEGENAGKVLLKALDDKSFFVRANAVIALGNLQYTPAVAPVIAVIQNDISDLPTHLLPIILPKVIRALWRLNAGHEEMSRFYTFVARELAKRAEVPQDSQAIRETRRVLAAWGLPDGWHKPAAPGPGKGKAGRASSPVVWMRDSKNLPSVTDGDAIARVQEIAAKNFDLSKRGRGDLRYFLTGNKSFKSIELLLFVQSRDSINAENRTAVFREKTGILIAAYAGARWNLQEDEIRSIKTFIAENGKPEELKQKQFVDAFQGLLHAERNAADKEAIALEARQFLLSIAVTFPLKAASNPVADNEGRKMKDKGRGRAAKEVGGIDLNSGLLDLQIKRDGNGVPLPLPMQPIETMTIDGFIPVIIHIAPATDLPMLLGLSWEDVDAAPPGGDTASEMNPVPDAAWEPGRGLNARLSKRRGLPVHALRV